MHPDPDQRTPAEKPSFGWLLAGGTALLVILTYLLLVRYAYPANDDWVFAAAGRDAGVWASLTAYWHAFGGRWASILLLHALGWLNDLPSVYPALTAIVFAAVTAAGWPILRCLGMRDHRQLWIGTICLAAVQFTALPVLNIGNVGPHAAMPETLYWLSGSLSYAIAYPLLALTVWLSGTTRHAWLGWGAAIACGIIVSGLSEMAGILAVVVGASLGLAGFRRGWALAAAAMVGLGIVASAPGNLKRLTILQSEVQTNAGLSNLPRAMLYAAWLIGSHLWEWILNPAVVAWCGCAVWWGTATKSAAGPLPRRFVLIAGLATIAATWSMAVPTFALVGFLEARHEGIVSLTAIAGLAVTAVLAGRAWPERLQGHGAKRTWPPWMTLAILVRSLLPSAIEPSGVEWLAQCGLCLGLVCAGMGFYGRNVAGGLLAIGLILQPAWWQAVVDAWRKAPEQHALQLVRDAEVRRLRSQDIIAMVLPWLGEPKRMPRTIRLYELQPGWMANAYAAYFRLSQVRVSPSISAPVALPVPEAGEPHRSEQAP